ncbi:MAG: Wzz/FepE/Etk N-terminal domain-containing protein, partial [Longimicrobiales bacterium]
MNSTPPDDQAGTGETALGGNGSGSHAVARSDAHPLGFDPFSSASGAWATNSGPALVEENIDWQRKLRGLWRYRWLILATTLLGSGAGFAAYKLYPEEYVARGAVWVQQTSSEELATGPIRSGGMLRQQEWIDLLESYAVLDPVVVSEGLQVVPDKPEHQAFLSTITLGDAYVNGFYRLEVNASKTRLELYRGGARIERADVGQAMGTSSGFLWVPDLSLVDGGDEVVFALATVRDAADNLNRELQAF